ncbi:DUF551 domain-containing protein [Escherichia coli]|uniref:DUF551 domain-containing protein n=1 Tax=Escherichia coli TaxID=562 RepID=UPI0026660817|nr:DUF551 domain-containing protein [Escherichia coli]EJM9747510.1 DUF551 domain-containing protein [Escherichia coli]MDO2478122.1 DUF551 domain-containing protein [Escherichia coli]MDO2525819.1 DUF551 domain-containing protein [Escherichia coli]MEC6656213.1 DUF551 domain-containing protein [Escherichia coli]HAX8378324.1 DUF551 domain-containing protein [Escherichia coli]
MTTITKERLLTIKQWRETYGPGSNVVLPAEEAEELARIALASLEAEPIGFRCRRNDNLGDWSYVYHREPDDFERKHLVIEGIYAAPPAPVVPEEMYWQDAPVEGSSKAAAYATGWNDCREAMLQSGNFRENKDSSTNNFRKIPEASTSSPVTPDGWISCSDRIPEMGERQYYVLAADFKNNYPPSIPNTQVGVYGDWFNDGNPTWNDGDGEDLHLKEVTHWMPLPEPPKEVRQ